MSSLGGAMSNKGNGGGSISAGIELRDILGLISTKQTQYYVLWAGYATVQFTAASFGTADTLKSHAVVYVVLAGVWMFNIGHLGFVIQCVAQLNKLRNALDTAFSNDRACFYKAAKAALTDMGVATFFWSRFDKKPGNAYFLLNIIVHLWIDICASLALLYRANMLL
jgi:hypothetical protein